MDGDDDDDNDGMVRSLPRTKVDGVEGRKEGRRGEKATPCRMDGWTDGWMEGDEGMADAEGLSGNVCAYPPTQLSGWRKRRWSDEGARVCELERSGRRNSNLATTTTTRCRDQRTFHVRNYTAQIKKERERERNVGITNSNYRSLLIKQTILNRVVNSETVLSKERFPTRDGCRGRGNFLSQYQDGVKNKLFPFFHG